MVKIKYGSVEKWMVKYITKELGKVEIVLCIIIKIS